MFQEGQVQEPADLLIDERWEKMIFLFSLITAVLAITLFTTAKVEKLEKRIKELEQEKESGIN